MWADFTHLPCPSWSDPEWAAPRWPPAQKHNCPGPVLTGEAAHRRHQQTWLRVRPWMEASPILAFGCGQAEWLPWPCQVVIKPPGTRDLPVKGVQGQWKEPASKFQEPHGVYSEASLPSPTPLEATAAYKGRVWRDSRLNNSVIRSTSLFWFL